METKDNKGLEQKMYDRVHDRGMSFLMGTFVGMAALAGGIIGIHSYCTRHTQQQEEHVQNRAEYAHVVNYKQPFARQVNLTYLDVKAGPKEYEGEISESILIYDLDGDHVADQAFVARGELNYYKELIFRTTDRWKNYVAVEPDSAKAAELHKRLLIDNNITAMTDSQRQAYTAVLNLDK